MKRNSIEIHHQIDTYEAGKRLIVSFRGKYKKHKTQNKTKTTIGIE